VPAFAVLDLDHPDVRVDPRGAFGVGVQVRLEVGADRLHPEALAVAARGFAVELGGVGAAVDGLDQHGPGPRVALAGHHGEGAAQFGAADQRADPDVRRK
jgi:hypothetical protein